MQLYLNSEEFPLNLRPVAACEYLYILRDETGFDFKVDPESSETYIAESDGIKISLRPIDIRDQEQAHTVNLRITGRDYVNLNIFHDEIIITEPGKLAFPDISKAVEAVQSVINEYDAKFPTPGELTAVLNVENVTVSRYFSVKNGKIDKATYSLNYRRKNHAGSSTWGSSGNVGTSGATAAKLIKRLQPMAEKLVTDGDRKWEGDNYYAQLAIDTAESNRIARETARGIPCMDSSDCHGVTVSFKVSVSRANAAKLAEFMKTIND